jgi:hypothetical protein
MSGECSTQGKMRNVYRISAGKLEMRRPLERPRRRWDDNITMHPKEMVEGNNQSDSVRGGEFFSDSQ